MCFTRADEERLRIFLKNIKSDIRFDKREGKNMEKDKLSRIK